jgi:hypothetical protein
MNAIIGMCKKDIDWITVLSDTDVNYEVQIIEQSISTSRGEIVKPDVITASNRQLHSIVFELKGGKTLKLDQLERYEGLSANDLLRWITVFDRTHLEFDVCICDFAENHELVKSVNNNKFPILIFGSETLIKEGTFKRSKLNEAFGEHISLKGKTQPLSYYPFSDEDSIPYIALHVIQALLSTIQKGIKQGKNVSEETLFTFDDIITERFNYVWRVLSIEHKKALKLKVSDATKRFLAKEEVKETLGIIQQKEGYKITKNLDQFKKIAEKYIEELQTQASLSGFYTF